MGIEIERKFLVRGNSWRNLARGVRYRQGYIFASREKTVRVRVDGSSGSLTIKAGSKGIVRKEFEYEIPLSEADELLDQVCERPIIEKNRYTIEHDGLTWEVDEFFGENSGLIVAEVELERLDQSFSRPEWVDREVSGDSRYFNAALVRNPYCLWEKNCKIGGPETGS